MKKFIIYIVLIFGCSNSNTKDVYESEIKNTKIHEEGIDSLEMMQGVWAEDSTSNAYFIVKGDSIYSVDDRKGLYFQISDDTLFISYDWGKMDHFVLKLFKDSLIMKNRDSSIVKLYKR